MLDRVRFVLVNTSHPGNIGAVARALKTMGLKNLFLVSPKEFPHAKANEMASGAIDVLENTTVVNDLPTAIKDCALVIGTSARLRAIPWPLLTPKEVAVKVKAESEQNQIAIVFGREQSGLTNQELALCHLHMHIPANPDYSSLNIAAAVQIAAYELRMINQVAMEASSWDCDFANTDDMEKFFEHLKKVLIEIDFLKATAPRKLMMRLRRLFLRTRLDVMEINILRGILTAIQTRIRKSNA